MKINKDTIIVSILITVATLFFPFKVPHGNEIHLGYPLRFFTIFKSAFMSISTGWHTTVLQLIGIDLVAFCLDVAVIYIVIVTLEKGRKKLAK